MLKLNNLTAGAGARKSRKRVGRGIASQGKTCGRGHKGQKSRSGGYHKQAMKVVKLLCSVDCQNLVFLRELTIILKKLILRISMVWM